MNIIDEAIAELEALQQRSCNGCKYFIKIEEFYTYCSNKDINAMFGSAEELLPMDNDFCCNRYEPKEQ